MSVFKDKYGYLRIGWILAIVLASAALLVGVILFTGRQVDHNHAKGNCPERGAVMGRPTKFVDLSFWSYGCYAQADNGTWLPVEQFRAGES